MASNAESLAEALVMARALHSAADEVSRLSFGASGYEGYYSGGGSRSADKVVATRQWIGTSKDHFEGTLYQNEAQSAIDTSSALREEAAAWAGFWADETNAQNEREFDQQWGVYQTRSNDHTARSIAFANDETGLVPHPGSEPSQPRRAPVALQPTAPSFFERFAG